MSTFKENIEKLTNDIAQLQETVKSNAGDAVLDKERVVAIATELIDERAKAIVDEQLANSAPQRRTLGDNVGAYDFSGVKAGNRYAKNLSDIQKDGYTKVAGRKMKAVDLWLANQMIEAQVKHYDPRMMGERPEGASDDLKAAVKALTSTGSGTGDEYVPTMLAEELWEDFYLASRVVGTLTPTPMLSNPFDVPLGLGNVTWHKGTENTAVSASEPATAKSILTATELATEQQWSYTLNEDAIVAMAPTLRARLAQSGGEIMDDFALNADGTNAATGNINLDDADPADSSYYISDGQDGIRHQWLVDNATQTVNAGGDALTDADVVAALTKMGKYAINPSNVVIVCDVSTYLNGFLFALDGVLTIDKFGPDAVLRTGQLAAYRGIPVIPSASHRLAEADGKLSTTGSNNTLGSISIYNTNMWYAGFLRDLVIEIDKDIQKRQYIMVTSLREAVAAHGTRSSATHTAGIRNILV